MNAIGRFLAALAFVLLPMVAHAQIGDPSLVTLGPATPGTVIGTVTPTNSAGSFSAATVTNSSAQVLAAGVAKTILDIKNESTSATIACAFGALAALNTAGSYTIPPQWHRSWEGSYVPSDVVNCISSVGSSPATIEAK